MWALFMKHKQNECLGKSFINIFVWKLLHSIQWFYVEKFVLPMFHEKGPVCLFLSSWLCSV